MSLWDVFNDNVIKPVEKAADTVIKAVTPPPPPDGNKLAHEKERDSQSIINAYQTSPVSASAGNVSGGHAASVEAQKNGFKSISVGGSGGLAAGLGGEIGGGSVWHIDDFIHDRDPVANYTGLEISGGFQLGADGQAPIGYWFADPLKIGGENVGVAIEATCVVGIGLSFYWTPGFKEYLGFVIAPALGAKAVGGAVVQGLTIVTKR